MSTVTLDADGARVDVPLSLPARIRLTSQELGHLTGLLGLPVPAFAGFGRAGRFASGLGSGQSGQTPADAVSSLCARGVLDPHGSVAAGPLAALRVLAEPEVMVSLDVGVRRAAAPDGSARVVSWQCCRGGLVATLSTAGSGVFEMRWLAADLWRFELARAATVNACAGASPAVPRPAVPRSAVPSPAVPRSAVPRPAPPPVTELPYELVLAAGACLRDGREDLFGELLGRYAAEVRAGAGDKEVAPAQDPSAVVRAATLGATARLRATVLAAAPGQARIGVAHWLGFDDGWRRLEPFLSDDLPMVRLRPAQPADLGTDVARLLAGVRR